MRAVTILINDTGVNYYDSCIVDRYEIAGGIDTGKKVAPLRLQQPEEG